MRDHHAPRRERSTRQLAAAQWQQARHSETETQCQAQQRKNANVGENASEDQCGQHQSTEQRDFLADPVQTVLPPAQQWPHTHDNQHGNGEDRPHGVEVRRPHGHAHVESFGQQRIEGTKQYDRQNGAQHHVIEDQRPFAAGNPEALALADGIGAQGEQQQRAADEYAEQDKDKGPAFRVDGKGVHAGQDARTHKECADHAHGKGDDAKHNCPRPQRIPAGQDAGGMEERGRCKPGHEGGIFDRVPEPPAAPAQFVIGPVTPCRDPDSQPYPRTQHPGPHGAGKLRRDLPCQ